MVEGDIVGLLEGLEDVNVVGRFELAKGGDDGVALGTKDSAVGSNDGALVGSAAGYGVGLVVGGNVGGQGSFKYTEVALEISSSSGFSIDKNRLTAALVPSELSRH